MSIINILFIINIIYFSIILIIEIFFSDMNLYTTGITLLFLLVIIIYMIYLNIIRKKSSKYLSDREPLLDKAGNKNDDSKENLILNIIFEMFKESKKENAKLRKAIMENNAEAKNEKNNWIKP